MSFLNYAYVFLWAALAVLVLIIGRKELVLAALMSAFFVFMTVWYGLRAFGGIAMFNATICGANFSLPQNFAVFLKKRLIFTVFYAIMLSI